MFAPQKGYPEQHTADEDDSTFSFGTKRLAAEATADFHSSADAAAPFKDFVPSAGSAGGEGHGTARACSARILDSMEPEAAGGAFVRQGAKRRMKCRGGLAFGHVLRRN